MDRTNKRKHERLLSKIMLNAKKDMEEYLDSLGDSNITVEEMKAWKFGYIAGINRARKQN